jgi:hypothetical protein
MANKILLRAFMFPPGPARGRADKELAAAPHPIPLAGLFVAKPRATVQGNRIRVMQPVVRQVAFIGIVTAYMTYALPD